MKVKILHIKSKCTGYYQKAKYNNNKKVGTSSFGRLRDERGSIASSRQSSRPWPSVLGRRGWRRGPWSTSPPCSRSRYRPRLCQYRKLVWFTHGDELGEMLLVFLLVLLREGVHVFGDVATEDVLLVDISVELAVGETWEALWRVGDVQTGISSTLQDTEDTGTS